MPTALEKRIARGRGICFEERDLAEAIADFYLLETLSNVMEFEAARSPLEHLERQLADDFAAYLDLAIGGELRHAKNRLCPSSLPEELAPFFREVSERRLDRGAAWLVWSVIRRKLDSQALVLAELAFRARGWDRNFGGEAWAQVTSVLRSYLEGVINRRIFVDRCFALEHNSGPVLDKLWGTRNVRVMLDAHGIDDYATLLSFASSNVHRLWRQHEWVRRRDHDPVWLGIQPTDFVDEAALQVALA